MAVVCDKHDGEPKFALNATQLVLQFLAHNWVDRAERLVHQQDVGFDGEGSSDPDSLLLATRQLLGVSAEELFVDPDHGQHFGCVTLGDVCRLPSNTSNETHVFTDCFVGE